MDDKETRYELKVGREQRKRWAAAAELRKWSLATWVRHVCDMAEIDEREYAETPAGHRRERV